MDEKRLQDVIKTPIDFMIEELDKKSEKVESQEELDFLSRIRTHLVNCKQLENAFRLNFSASILESKGRKIPERLLEEIFTETDKIMERLTKESFESVLGFKVE